MQSTSPKKSAFVLMPFKSEFDDIYKLGIKPACEAAGAYCERVDEQYYEGSMLDRIYNQISKADVIIADMTGQNPNVFYETGYAHALSKKVILITQRGEDIPFDLKHFYHIVYENGKISYLQEQLKNRTSWFLKQPDKQILDNYSFLEIYSYGNKVFEDAMIDVPEGIMVPHLSKGLFGFFIDFSIYNSSNSLLDGVMMETSMFLPKYLSVGGNDEEVIITPDNRKLVYLDRIREMMPHGWRKWRVYVEGRNQPKNAPLSIETTFRVSSENGVSDVKFFLRLF